MKIEQLDFEHLCTLVYKDYGKTRYFMQRENTQKYKNKMLKVLEYLEQRGYIK